MKYELQLIVSTLFWFFKKQTHQQQQQYSAYPVRYCSDPLSLLHCLSIPVFCPDRSQQLHPFPLCTVVGSDLSQTLHLKQGIELLSYRQKHFIFHIKNT